jgi:MYXO-CTERM domain-containing protein
MASLHVLVSFRARPVLGGTIAGLAASVASAQITIPTVPVGNPGNAADSTGFGSVAYSYNIGTYEVTAGQYTAFLNAVAATDTNALYNTNMANAVSGSGITRGGSSGTYTYSVNAMFVNRPVNYVSFWDATRFANWLHNGQPAGTQSANTTEDGAYTLTPGGISANTVTRNAGWQWAVTSENEWYKAAYHQPASQGGDADDYWLYPTRSNTAPGTDLADPFGNNANYYPGSGPYPIDAPYYTTMVGEFQNSSSFYGTFDQGGNVWECNEATPPFGLSRGSRGGSFLNVDLVSYLQASSRSNAFSGAEVRFHGFRVSQIPGPSSFALLALGGLGVGGLRRRRR